MLACWSVKRSAVVRWTISRGVKCSPAVSLERLREAPDQFLEHQTHVVVVECLRAQVHAGELLHHQVEQVRLVELLQEAVEAEMLEDLPGIRAEAADVGIQVVEDLGLAQGAQVHGRGVVERQLGGLLQEGIERQVGVLALVILRQYRALGRRQHTLQAAQQGERQDDPAVLRLLEVTSEQVCHRPDEGCCGGEVFSHVLVRSP
jgi:hypothetical protein